MPLAGFQVHLIFVIRSHPHFAVNVVGGRRYHGDAGRWVFFVMWSEPGLKFFGLAVKLHKGALVHHSRPDVPILVKAQVERTSGGAWLRERKLILRNLAGLG